MTNQAPTQIIMSGADVYYAPVGTAFPADTRAALDPTWKPLSVLGRVVQSDAGVTLTFGQDFEQFQGQGNFPIKVSRTKENQMVTVSIADTSNQAFAVALNSNTVSTSAATATAPGMETLNTARGEDVNYISLLIRGQSPASTDPLARRQVQVPKCYQSGEIKPAFSRQAAMLDFEFTVVRGPNATDADPDVIKMLVETDPPTA